MDASPILFFDSGVGGLSVLAAVARALPALPLVYCADTAGFPYGTRPEREIATRVPVLLGRLVERVRPRLVVIACNTASTIALGPVRAALDVPVVGTVPAIKPAAEASRSRVIGVLGTEATVRQPYVDDLSQRFASDCLVLRHGSAALVEAAEAHLRGGVPDPEIFRSAIEGLTLQQGGERMDVLVLACTHFPLVARQLRAASPQPFQFIDGSAGIARRVRALLGDAPGPEPRPAGRFIATRRTAGLDLLIPALAQYGLTKIEQL
jgi:glutamate racemase